MKPNTLPMIALRPAQYSWVCEMREKGYKFSDLVRMGLDLLKKELEK